MWKELAGLLRWWSCCNSVLTADVTYSWLGFSFKPRVSIFQSKRFLCVLKSKPFPCYYKTSSKTEDPLKRFQGPMDPQGSCDKLLSSAPAVAQGCGVYSFLELGFVGFGSHWQHFGCVQVSCKHQKSALGMSVCVYTWIYVQPSDTAFCKNCLGNLWADLELFRKHDLPGFVKDSWNLKSIVATVTLDCNFFKDRVGQLIPGPALLFYVLTNIQRGRCTTSDEYFHCLPWTLGSNFGLTGKDSHSLMLSFFSQLHSVWYNF